MINYAEIVDKHKNRPINNPKKQKVFCIGRNKTGTTSLKTAMTEFGYSTGDQQNAELLHEDWVKRDFNRILHYCYTADFFQDIPFSLPYTYIILDYFFPNSKFILTIRDSAEQWYNSLVRFHTSFYGMNGLIPTKDDLQNSTNIYKGWAWEVHSTMFNVDSTNIYNKNILIEEYNRHNLNIKKYFKSRSKDLLVINLAEENSLDRLTLFLNVKKTNLEVMPWENKS